MTEGELDEGLKTLQASADAHFVTYERSRKHLWRLLAKAYLWWCRASEKKGHLEKLYKRHGIGFRTTDASPNFSPLIRLIWNFDEPANSEIKQSEDDDESEAGHGLAVAEGITETA
jgi:hypothetical protein